MKKNNAFVFSQIFWKKQSEEVQCHGRETNPPDSTSQVVFITHFHTRIKRCPLSNNGLQCVLEEQIHKAELREH